MPVPAFDGVFYVREVPEVFYEDGLFHISYRAGKARFQFVLLPHIALKTRARAQQATDEFHETVATVTRIKR